MASTDIDLLAADRGLVVAPAGCGKTQLIASALGMHDASKPVLVLTHTNAGVDALRSRLDRAGIKPSHYRLSTIDGWAIRLITLFPQRVAHDVRILTAQRPDYPAIRLVAAKLLQAGHIDDVIAASYSHLFVDEYQDCSVYQHALVCAASQLMPTCVVGDEMQAIFGFDRQDPLADWDRRVCTDFRPIGELDRPWRWINADAEPLGHWLLDARRKLMVGEPIHLADAPGTVTLVALDGSAADHGKLLTACMSKPPSDRGSVLILGESTNPAGQRRLASQTPGAVAVEAVDLRDMVSFAGSLDIAQADALQRIVDFAQELMTNVGAADLVRRVEIIRRGTARKAPSDIEMAAISFLHERSYRRVSDLLVAISRGDGVRVFRPSVFHACLRALERCHGSSGLSFYDAAVHMREQNRLLGRPLPRRAVGSTLRLKELEAEVAVILNGDQLDAKNLYVAMTRGSKKLVICSRSPVLRPAR